MKSKPRTVCRLRSLVLVALVLAFASIPVLSQKRGRTQPKATTQNKSAERVRRAQAVTLLVETADKARLFDALFYRARIQMLAADALWPHDERQARAIFRRAWEAATASDKAEKEEAARGTDLFPATNENVTDARDEVLRKAAVRDARLAEIFLRDLLGEKDGASVDRNEATRRLAGGLLSANGARRLTLAYEMLEAGETRRAVEIIAPTINEGVGSELIAFIVRLRERSITDADMLYLRLIEHAAADPQTDANAVLLLSSPIVSPRLIVVVDEFGAVQFSVLTPASANAVTQQPVNERANSFLQSGSVCALTPLNAARRSAHRSGVDGTLLRDGSAASLLREFFCAVFSLCSGPARSPQRTFQRNRSKPPRASLFAIWCGQFDASRVC
jgi:hypothetical protein